MALVLVAEVNYDGATASANFDVVNDQVISLVVSNDIGRNVHVVSSSPTGHSLTNAPVPAGTTTINIPKPRRFQLSEEWFCSLVVSP